MHIACIFAGVLYYIYACLMKTRFDGFLFKTQRVEYYSLYKSTDGCDSMISMRVICQRSIFSHKYVYCTIRCPWIRRIKQKRTNFNQKTNCTVVVVSIGRKFGDNVSP